MSLVDQYHAEHKARQSRIAAKAFRKVVVAEIVPEPEAIIVEAEPLRVLFCKPDQVDIGSIKRAACRYFGISHVQIVSPRREREIVNARQVAIYLSRKLREDLSSRFIANQFGNRDHSTIIHAVKKVGQLVKLDWTFAYDVAHIEAML